MSTPAPPLPPPPPVHACALREVLEEIRTLSDLLGQVPSMSFDGLRPILAKNGLSEVGTLGELSSRAAKVLEGRIKAAAGGGGLSNFGERAARILFRMADRVRWSRANDRQNASIGAVYSRDFQHSRAFHGSDHISRVGSGQGDPARPATFENHLTRPHP